MKNPLIWYCIYPRKGTETCGNPPKPPGNRLQFIPVRGQKFLPVVPPVTQILKLQLIPARGRKPSTGNSDNSPVLLQFIPVRGRKRCIPTTYQSHVSTIPVRGRKLVRPAVNRCNVGTIPVRGRKLTTHGANAQTATLQFIPARGRKLHVQVKHAHLFHNCNLSPQGDKKAPLPLAFASSGGALLFLIFYFTGWELRLPESSL